MDNSPLQSKLRSWFAFALRLLGFWEVLTAAGYFSYRIELQYGFHQVCDWELVFRLIYDADVWSSRSGVLAFGHGTENRAVCLS
jgi:hypothetical protein